MRSLFFVSFLAFAFTMVPSSMAQDHLLKFRSDQPDVLIQAGISESQKTIFFNQARNALIQSKNVDLLDARLKLAPLDPIQSGLGIEEYIDKKVIKIIKNALRFNLKQVTTTLDLYKMEYRVGQPTLSLLSTQENENSMDLTLGFKVNHLEIDVENIMVNNHSPGVHVTPQDENGQMRVTGKEKMTFIDDIYIKLVSPKDRPILEIDSNGTEKSVVSGQIAIRLHRATDSSLRVEYLSHQLNFFDRSDASVLADRIRIYLGEGSRIGGLDAIEIGKSELKFQNDISSFVQLKKVLLINLIADHLEETVQSDSITETLRNGLEHLKIEGSSFDSLVNASSKNLGITSQINTIGILDQNSEIPQFHLSFNQSLLWLQNAFIKPDELPFPVSSSTLYGTSLNLIRNQITSGESDLIVSFGQDYLNHSLLTLTRGILKLPNDPSTRKDDVIHNGKKGVFVIFDDVNDQHGKIVVDILVKPRFFQSLGLAITTFKSKLYFPLVIKPEISFEITNAVPELVLKVKDFDLSDETLRNGIHGVGSNLNRGILNKLILKKIRKSLNPMLGRELKRIQLPFLSGLDLGKILSVHSDGLGRLNLGFKLNEVDTIPAGLIRHLSFY